MFLHLGLTRRIIQFRLSCPGWLYRSWPCKLKQRGAWQCFQLELTKPAVRLSPLGISCLKNKGSLILNEVQCILQKEAVWNKLYEWKVNTVTLKQMRHSQTADDTHSPRLKSTRSAAGAMMMSKPIPHNGCTIIQLPCFGCCRSSAQGPWEVDQCCPRTLRLASDWSPD